ncbi:hypothetical protein Tco_1553898 [Tanacetum coccineum]
MELELEIKVPGLDYDRSLPEGVLFVNYMVIEEPEYGIFFTDLFGNQAFQRWNDIHKVGMDSLVSYLVMASMIKTLENSSTTSTPIVDKIDKFEQLIIDGKVSLVDDEKRVGFDMNSLLKQWRDTYENADYDYDPYDDDMYEGHEVPDKIQSICDNLDIKVRGRKKK